MQQYALTAMADELSKPFGQPGQSGQIGQPGQSRPVELVEQPGQFGRPGQSAPASNFDHVALAQRSWAAEPVGARLKVIRKLRKRIAAEPLELAEAVLVNLPGALSRHVADTLVSEVLPLVEALRFLEREAERTLATRVLGEAGRPAWLSGLDSRVERAPWGLVLVLGASNYPLLLAGVQVIQALVAGNGVLWKPAPGTSAVASILRDYLLAAGLAPELLMILTAGIESAHSAIAAGVDHVVLTGSAETGRAVLRQLAETLTPATMELSGCDAVFVLPGADLSRLVQALVFGLRFNGSFTCMAPRRIFMVGSDPGQVRDFENELVLAMSDLPTVDVPTQTLRLLRELILDAADQGGNVLLNGSKRYWTLPGEESHVGATLISGAIPAMLVMQTDVFAPILSLMRVADVDEALAANAACPYALTASIFGPEKKARALAGRLRVGNVLINDLITSTADPRVPFGGRGRSGFGVTRGAEGLLAMTTPRTIQVKTGRSVRAYQATGDAHVPFFVGLIQVLHGGGLGVRLAGLKRLFGSARKLK